MTTSLQELLAQRAEIEKQIADAQREERTAAITQIKSLMADFGLTATDITARSTAPRGGGSKSGTKVAPKYRNAATGETWTGRGLQPKWLKSALAAGANLNDFVI